MRQLQHRKNSWFQESPCATSLVSMALFYFLLFVLLFVPVRAAGHSMGEAVPVAFVEDQVTGFAANVVAAYFGEQMGREMSLVPGVSVKSCLDMLRSGKAPMAVLDVMPEKSSLMGIVVVDPLLVVGGKTRILVMGDEAAKQLQFSLVPKYMRKLKDHLSSRDWETGLARVRAGEGIRKIALDTLKGRDLI